MQDFPLGFIDQNCLHVASFKEGYGTGNRIVAEITQLTRVGYTVSQIFLGICQ